MQHTAEIPDVELAMEYFTNSSVAIIDKHFKMLRVKDRSSPWFFTELSMMFRARDKAWALARRTGEAAFKQLL